MEARQHRIGLLARANHGRIIGPSVVAGLSEALRGPIEIPSFASLEQTDRLASIFWKGYESACDDLHCLSYRRTFPLGEEKLVFELANRMAAALTDQTVWVLLTRFAEYCGALSVDASALFSNARSVISFDQNSICAISHDEQEGLLLDYTRDDPEETFELAVWGNRWPLLVLSCDSKRK